jgi:hypothetical protein
VIEPPDQHLITNQMLLFEFNTYGDPRGQDPWRTLECNQVNAGAARELFFSSGEFVPLVAELFL